jgi:hypothetical protein
MLASLPVLRRFAPLAFVFLVLAQPEVARAQVTVPDIVVTSMTTSDPDKNGGYWSGVETGQLGSVANSVFPAGTYAAGTSITVTVRATAGYVFQLNPNDQFLFSFGFKNAAGGGTTIQYSPTTATFLDVQGGTLDGDNQFSSPAIGVGAGNPNNYTIYNSASLFSSGLTVTGTTTFSALQFITVLSSELTLSELTLDQVRFEVHSVSPGALSMVAASAVPEPSTYGAIFGALALGAVGVARRRRAPVAQN